MPNQEQRGRGFWIGLAIIFILSFLTMYAVAEEPIQNKKAEIEKETEIKPIEIKEGDIIIYESKDKLTRFPVKIKQFVLNEEGEDRVLVVRKDNITAGFVVPVERLGYTECFTMKDLESPQFRYEVGERVHRDYYPMIVKDRKSVWGKNLYLIRRIDERYDHEEIFEENELSYSNVDQLRR